jgi:lipopolysaccharide export system permease protein
MVIDRYITSSVVKGVLIASMVMAALFGFISFVGELDQIGTAKYNLVKALFYVALTLPQQLYELAPSIILLGGLISLGAMAAGSELVVMRASGITAMRIVRSVMQTGLILAIFVALGGEYFVPVASSKGKSIRAHALDQRLLASGQHGFWARDNMRYVHARRVMPEKKLGDVSVYEIDKDRQLVRITRASRAEYSNGQWNLFDVVHSHLSEDTVSSETISREVWPELIRPRLFAVLRLAPEDMSAQDLYAYGRYLEKNGLDAVEYQLAFWIKLFTPLTCLAMLLIAMPMVFNATPRSGGTGQRVIAGLLLGIIFFVLNRAANHLGVVYNVPPFISAIVPLLVITSIAILLLRKVR